MNIKKGDIVGRISYGKAILFMVKKVIKLDSGKSFAILKGLTVRIEADSPIDDLELINKKEIDKYMNFFDKELKKRRKKKGFLTRLSKNVITGSILHLDGDRKYSEKSLKFYRELGLNAFVKNIPESKQPNYVIPLLNRYNPDILVITGHDAMLRTNTNYNDIYNYRNSRHFVSTVKHAREWKMGNKDLVIFAGACQSYFEALMIAGANFASSPRKNSY